MLTDLLFKFIMGFVYVPLLVRAGHRSFTAQQVRKIFEGLPVRGLEIEAEQAYQDFIVAGEKA